MPGSSWVELHVTQAHLNQGKISYHVASPSSGDCSLNLQFKLKLKSKMMVIEETAKIKPKRQYYLPWYKAFKSHFSVFQLLSFLVRIYLLYHFICQICTCTSLRAQQSEGTEIHRLQWNPDVPHVGHRDLFWKEEPPWVPSLLIFNLGRKSVYPQWVGGGEVQDRGKARVSKCRL